MSKSRRLLCARRAYLELEYLRSLADELAMRVAPAPKSLRAFDRLIREELKRELAR